MIDHRTKHLVVRSLCTADTCGKYCLFLFLRRTLEMANKGPTVNLNYNQTIESFTTILRFLKLMIRKNITRCTSAHKFY